jgi:peptide/nickel transport system permease protein
MAVRSLRQIQTKWQILRYPGPLTAAIVVLLFAALAIVAPLIAPYDPYAQDLLARVVPPVWHDRGTWTHLLGTDNLGRDYLSRLLYGARVSLSIGLTTAATSAVIGSALGVTAGYFGGRIDALISFLITARLAMPVILVALAVVALFGSSYVVVISVLGLLLWDRFALVLRGATQQVRHLDFVTASRIEGASHWYVMRRDILPNVANAIVVVATLEVGQAIVLEAALSFLGLGVPAPIPSWGLMLSEGKSYILFDPWMITIPGICLFLLVLSINMVGDGLQDMMAPEARGR